MTIPKFHNRQVFQTFTLLEVLIVFVVIGLILAVAAPKLMEKSARMTEENALSAIRNAINETSMRARMSGQALTLTLDTEDNSLQAGSAESDLERKWQPPNHANDSEERPPAFLFQGPTSFNLPNDIVWEPEDEDLDDDGNVVFTFFPDGQAAAHAIHFSIGEKNFILQIDRLTADPVILLITD